MKSPAGLVLERTLRMTMGGEEREMWRALWGGVLSQSAAILMGMINGRTFGERERHGAGRSTR